MVMAYVPKKRVYKIRWKIALPLCILVLLLVYMGISFVFQQKQETKQNFSVCGFDENKTKEVLNKKYAETIMVADYLYYGESLSLFEKEYSPLNKDTLSGKTVELRNLCDGKATALTLENTADQRIALDELTPGFYDVTIIDSLVRKRLVFDKPLEENVFYTAKRNGKVNKITLIADQNLLKSYEVAWDKHYFFIQVEEETPDNGEIDVLLDPFGMNTDLTLEPDKGNEANGLVENKEMYEAALLMKKELEGYGLRVDITKKSENEVGKAYGEDGRLAKGYNQNAKYYIFMRMNKMDLTSTKGLEIHHSSYSSATLAKAMMYGLTKNAGITPCPYYTVDRNNPGVIPSIIGKGSDNQLIYDTNLNLRESGGRATLAGKYSDTSKEANRKFVNANGMQGIEIDFAYISNKEDAENWKKNKEKIIKETARSFAQGINVLKDK